MRCSKLGLFVLCLLPVFASGAGAQTLTSTVHQDNSDLNFGSSFNFATYDFTATNYNTFTSFTSFTSLNITLTLTDGDTGVGDFDTNHLFLGLDGFNTGIALNGFRDGATDTQTFNGTFNNAANILSALKSDGKLVGSVIDITPGDNSLPSSSSFQTTLTLNGTPAAVPEPGSLALLAGMGAVGAGFIRRRKQASKAA